METAGRNDRPGRHAVDPAPQRRGRRRRRDHGRDARRYPALRRFRPAVLPRRDAGGACRASGRGLRSNPRMGGGGSWRALRRDGGRHARRAAAGGARRHRRGARFRRRSGGARGLERDDDPDRVHRSWRSAPRAAFSNPARRGRPRTSTRISRPSNGASTRKRGRGARRAGGNSRRPRQSSPRRRRLARNSKGSLGHGCCGRGSTAVPAPLAACYADFNLSARSRSRVRP